MSRPASQPGPIDCRFMTIIGVMLPFRLADPGADADSNGVAVLEPVAANQFAKAPGLDLVACLIELSGAAMDDPGPMHSGLSARNVVQHRARAAGLGRPAGQGRKIPGAMQTKLQRRGDAAAMARAISMPKPRPTPIAPPPPAAPPRGKPPAQPHASTGPASAYSTSGRPIAMVERDSEFARDIDAMQRDTRAMTAGLHATARLSGFESPVARMGPARSEAPRPGKVA
jgi:hypothetical protein